MAMNRVQFQAGLSMPEFLNRYGSEQQCEAAPVAARWPRGFVCPVCGAGAHGTFVRGRRRYWQCAACRHQCSALSGTIFESTKLPLTRWFLAMHLLTQSKNNVSALELMRQLGVCYKSAWLLKHKVMEVMRVREAPRQLDGRVEIDDAYLGGERAGGKTGRGSENKVPFIAAVQTTPEGKPIYACFAPQPFTTEAVALFAASSLAPTAQVISDGLWCFGGVRSSAPSTSAWSPAAARPAPSCPSSRRSTPCWATSRARLRAPTMPLPSPSTPIATSPRSNIGSTVASISPPSWRVCCAPLASPRPGQRPSFAWLRNVANQDRR